MIKIIFVFNKKDKVIIFNTQEKIKIIMQSFGSKIGININEINFIYKGNIINDIGLTIDQIFKKRQKFNKMNYCI